MENFFNIDTFQDFAPDFLSNEQSSDCDQEILDTILSNLSEYDIMDFVCKLAAMNLVPDNQNKCCIFDKIIDHILLSNIELQQSQNKISGKKFRQIVNMGTELSVAVGIDPIEMPFIQRVQFYGNKWIFSGINSSPAYILQNFIDVLYKNANDFDKDFIILSERIVHFVLEISTKIVDRIKYTNSVFEHHEKNDIVYPQSTEHNKLLQALVFTEEEFSSIFDNDFKELVYYTKDSAKDIVLDYNHATFYYKPFLKINSTQFAVLNPTMLVPFAIYNILKISTEYGCRDELANLYNEKTWYECQQSLKKLEHKKISAKELGIELIDYDYYKEALFNAWNDGILFVRYFCDNAHNYNFSNMFATTTIEVSTVEERWKKVLDSAFKKDKFYQLTIINTLGRGVWLGFSRETHTNNMKLSPFELYCVSINECNQPNFLLHYMESKQILNKYNFSSIAEIDYITMFSENNYSFYISDDINLKETMLWVGLGDSIDYLNKALLSSDKQLAEIPGSNYFREIVLNEPERNIYCTTDKKDFTLLNRFKNMDIWVSAELPSSNDELNLLYSVLDLITYWFSECKSVVENNVFITTSLLIKNHFTGEPNEYYLANNVSNDDITTHLSSKIEGNIINIYWTPKAFGCLANESNISEKELIKWILLLVSSFSINRFNFSSFEKLFDNPLKTKVFALNYNELPYFKPLIGDVRNIPVEYEHQLLDEIGVYLRQTKKFNYGIIQGVEKHKICNDIVGFLYNKLQAEVSKFSSIGFYELLHYDLEQIIYSMMLTHRRYSYDIACYPERAPKIDRQYTAINQSSVATKFLLEYISATPPTGEQPLGEGDYEYMLTICSLIIEWAHNSDMFIYNMIDNDLEILKSGRIGLKKDKIEELANSNHIASKKRLNSISNPSVDLYIPQKPTSSKELDLVFEDEFSYTYTDLNTCIFKLLDIGDTINCEVKRMNRDTLCELIESDTTLQKQKIYKIIDDMSLYKRDDYLTPPLTFSKHDILPWKFNRKLSFIRRPITQVNNDLIWGNRQLYHSLRYLYDLIINGTLPVRENGKFKSYLGKLIDARGNDFNDVVADKLKTFESLIIDSKIKKINGKRISDHNGNYLGDVDVLAIIPSKKKIVVVEVKDFSLAKTPYQMHQQYLSVFCDDGSKLCYISKHKKRVNWVKEHIDDVIVNYNLEKGKWKVVEALVVDENIISNDFYHLNQTIILYSDLTDESLKRIKK